jgi:hypothetical protein
MEINYYGICGSDALASALITHAALTPERKHFVGEKGYE